MRVTTRGRRPQTLRRGVKPLRFAGTVQVGGYAIYYQTAGSAEEHRHTVVLLHGLAGSSGCWNAQLDSLGDHLYLVAVDLPGHGQSEGWGAADVGEYVEFLHRFLDALGLHQRVVVAGHSLGAAVALEFAARWPNRVSGVVVAGLGIRAAVDPEALAAVQRGEPPGYFLERQVGPLAPGEVARQVRHDWYATRPEVRYADLIAWSRFDSLHVLPRVVAPALVVGGEEDPIAPPESVRALWVGIPRADLEILPGLGHMMMAEDPLRFNEVLLRFLRGVHLPPRPVVPRL
ncbi:MAG: alpha/beta hydrolase [Bacillota bacterium]|nr:MAG: hypothetical protein DIU70_00915 [Bacillota bacterium]